MFQLMTEDWNEGKISMGEQTNPSSVFVNMSVLHIDTGNKQRLFPISMVC